jgi:hypothetical protein
VIVLPTKGAHPFEGILYAGSLILIPPARELGMQIFCRQVLYCPNVSKKNL